MVAQARCRITSRPSGMIGPMEALIHVIETYGLWVVFFSVLLDQGGLPTPSYAPMIVTAALATDAGQPLWPILLVGTLAQPWLRTWRGSRAVGAMARNCCA